MMKKLGVVTIGQAPRSDVAPILQKYIGGRAELIQVGVLDGFSREEIAETLSPGPHEYVLTSRLLTGEPVTMSREKITPILQEKIWALEHAGCRQILLLCTGVFPSLTTRTALLIEPDRVIASTVAAIVGKRRLGVVVPLEEQKAILAEKWDRFGIAPVFAAASPYHMTRETFQQAARELMRQRADLILLDCMGYGEECKAIAEEATGLPVILSNALIAKIVSEII